MSFKSLHDEARAALTELAAVRASLVLSKAAGKPVSKEDERRSLELFLRSTEVAAALLAATNKDDLSQKCAESMLVQAMLIRVLYEGRPLN